jgi:hypothetical protein
MDAYLTDWLEYKHRMRQGQERNPPSVVVRLRAFKTAQHNAPTDP